MKKLAIISMIGLSLASAASAASIMCQTTGWPGAYEALEKENGVDLSKQMPNKGFATIEKEGYNPGDEPNHLNIIFDGEKAYVCASSAGAVKSCTFFESVPALEDYLKRDNKLTSMKAFYQTPRGLLSIVYPAPKNNVSSVIEDGGVEVCYIR